MIKMKDIARMCGVSPAVVSLVLNGRDREVGIAEKTRQHILDTTRSLGYCRNEMAVSIAKKRGNILAFVSENMGVVEYTGRIQNGIFEEASKHGYAVMVYHLNEENAALILKKILGWCTSGVIFHVSSRENVKFLTESFRKNNIPFGFANLSNPEGIGVTSDDYAGAREAVAHLAAQNRKRILCIAGGNPLNKHPSEYAFLRMKGYSDGVKELLPGSEEKICFMDSLQGDPTQNLARILKEFHADGVFCNADHYAMRVFPAAEKLKLKVPEDIAIVGFGGLSIGDYAPVALSSIVQNFEEMGSLTVRYVIEAIEGREAPEGSRNCRLPVHLFVKESSKCCS